MNKAMSDKYREMNTLASGFTSQMQEVDQKCMCLKHKVTVCICLFFVLVFSMIVCLFWYSNLTVFRVFSDEELKPYLVQIDQVDAAVTELEGVVAQLNAFTKRLGMYNLTSLYLTFKVFFRPRTRKPLIVLKYLICNWISFTLPFNFLLLFHL